MTIPLSAKTLTASDTQIEMGFLGSHETEQFDESAAEITAAHGDTVNEAGDCYEELVAFGARSFSVWTVDGKLVADSGDEFEKLTAEAVPEFFNSNHSESKLEGRSDDKGPEPEALTHRHRHGGLLLHASPPLNPQDRPTSTAHHMS